jgi:hypothetical protein
MYKIYKLVNKVTGSIDYIGRTKRPLSKRYNNGWKNLNRFDYDIVLIEETDDMKKELFWITHYISLGFNLYNIQKGLNKDNQKQYRKRYYLSNKEEMSSKKKSNYEKNAEKILEKNRSYYEINKERIKQDKKRYREENKDILKEKRRLKQDKKTPQETRKSAGFFHT